MLTILEALQNGYFPKELPPPFTTSSFASLIASQSLSIPPSFSSGQLPNGSESAYLSLHHLTRVGKLQRRLGIPNPITHYRLCNEICQQWTPLSQHTQTSQLSASKPTTGTSTQRAIYPEYKHGELPKLRAEKHIGGRYFIKTDVSRFYHSIYTHSIPWALHTKPTAKVNRGMALLGNRLDKLVRDSQDGQTTGIPVGPDTSLLISEIVLTTVDNLVVTQLSSYSGFRYIDDYELCFHSLSDAENALQKLESALSIYELALNPLKTQIETIPLSLKDNWTTELNQFDIRQSGNTQQNDLIGYFNRAFELSKIYTEKSILRYAIARFRSTSIDPVNYPLFQNLLLHCVGCEQATLPYVLERFSSLYNSGYTTLPTTFNEVLNNHIKYHAPLGHTSEVSWAIWGSLAFNIHLDADSGTAISNIEDSIVVLLALHAEQKSLFTTPLDKNNWAKYMTPQGLYEENWLLSYEANVKGWLQGVGGIDHVTADTNFNFLKTNGVEFYDLTKTIPMLPPSIQPPSGPSDEY